MSEFPGARRKPTKSRSEAADYVGCKHSAHFVREQRAGIWPPPISPYRPYRWSTAALDRRLAAQARSATRQAAR